MVNTHYLVAAEGSQDTELLCKVVLEPRADELVGGANFKTAGVVAVEAEASVHFVNDAIVQTQFRAWIAGHKAPERTSGEKGWKAPELIARYGIVIGFVRPRTEDELWPDPEEHDDEEGDDDFQRYGGSLAFMDDGDDEDDEEDDDGNTLILMKDDTEYVREVWEYEVDDDTCRPTKEVSYEYYRAGKDDPFALVRLPHLGIGDLLLDEDPDNDIAFQINEALMRRSFSELDIELLEAVCDQDFITVLRMIHEVGGFDKISEDDESLDDEMDSDK